MPITRKLDLVVFEHEVDRVLPLREAGVCDFMVDMERRGKARRQLGADTEIGHASLSDVRKLARVERIKVHCRVNAWSARTRSEVEKAIGEGSHRIYLPMVQRREQAEAFLEAVDSRVETAILIETQTAAQDPTQFADLPLDAVFVGLNDLAISRGSSSIFSAVSDGTVENIRNGLSKPQFGFGGITCIDLGYPIPCRLIMAYLAAVGGSYSFLRRSFKRDIMGRDLPLEITRIHELWDQLLSRDPAQISVDNASLDEAIRRLDGK